MRIGIFTDTYFPQVNGVVTSIDIFTKELKKLGHEVLIFAPKVTGKEKKEKNVFRFGSMVFPFQPEHRICFPYSMDVPEFSELKIDIIHIQTPFSVGLLGFYLSQRYNVPLVYTHHTLFDEYVHYLPIIPSEIVKGFTAWASKAFCDRCNLIIAPSISIKELLEKHGVESEIVIIPTGIDLDAVKAVKPANLHRRYSLSAATKILIYAGRLGREKNIDFIVRALHKLSKKHENIHLFIIGDGPESKHLHALVKKLGLARKVTFTGYLKREEVVAACKGADLFVFASTTETQGLAVLEALSAGLPAVAVDAMGVSDVLKDNVGGLLTKEDINDFNDKVSKLLFNDKLNKQKVTEALSRAEKMSAKSATKHLVECYNKVLKRGVKR